MNISGVDDAAWGTVRDLAPYAVGFAAGWFALWRPRRLAAAGNSRPPVAVVVPARNEAGALSDLLGPLLAEARDGDEIVVVDDHSTDDTAAVAAALGARVLAAPALPDGWLGKPNACWHGAQHTTAPILVFVDADVRLASGALDRVATAVAAHPDRIVSVQPWHAVGRAGEQFSALFNISALMGVGAFSLAGDGHTERGAFGPVLAIRREVYARVGGHAHPAVRRRHTEDIALARVVGGAELFTGRPDVVFRMYPRGLRELVDGWTRSLASGVRSAPWWAVLATIAWIWSLAGGWIAVPWVYPLSALQVLVLGRRAGSFSPWVAVLYPLAVVVFVAVVVRSAWWTIRRHDVVWKDRRVPAR